MQDLGSGSELLSKVYVLRFHWYFCSVAKPWLAQCKCLDYLLEWTSPRRPAVLKHSFPQSHTIWFKAKNFCNFFNTENVKWLAKAEQKETKCTYNSLPLPTFSWQVSICFYAWPYLSQQLHAAAPLHVPCPFQPAWLLLAPCHNLVLHKLLFPHATSWILGTL